MERHHKRLFSSKSVSSLKQVMNAKQIMIEPKFNNKYKKSRMTEVNSDNNKIFTAIDTINQKGTKLKGSRITSSIYKPSSVNHLPKKIQLSNTISKENEVI